MSSLSQALSVALSGLQTSTSLISIASNNISNAQTAGYAAKSATVSSVQYGSDIGGATISSYSRASDAALSANYNLATSQSSYATTLNSYMTQAQSVLDLNDTTPALTNDIAQFSAAWSTYSAQPESTINQQALINTGTQLAHDIQSVLVQTSTLNAQIRNDTGTTVKSLNADLAQLATINSQIQQASTGKGSIVDLEDQRDALVNQISSMVSVTTQKRPNDQIALYTTTGQLLVDTGSALQFSYNGAAITDAHGTDITASLTGGSLQAQLDFTNTSTAAASSTTPGVGVIAKIQGQMQALVDAFTNTSGASTYSSGPNSAFATSYAAAAAASKAVGGVQAGATIDNNFFTATYSGGVPDASSFAVNANIVSGTSGIPQGGVTAVANSFSSTANYTAPGLSTSSATYANLGSAMLSSFQQTASNLKTQSTNLATQATYYKTTLSSETGVNIDTELAALVQYQNSYAASAHVISTVNQMLNSLMSIIGG